MKYRMIRSNFFDNNSYNDEKTLIGATSFFLCNDLLPVRLYPGKPA